MSFYLFTEEAEKKLSSPAFTVYWLLNSYGLENAEEIAKEMDKLVDKWQYWQTSEKHEREIRRGITKFLVKSEKDPAKVTEEVNNILRVLKDGSK